MSKSVRTPLDASKVIPIASGDSFGRSGFEYNKYDGGLNSLEYQDKMKFRQARQGIGEAVANSMGQILTTVGGQTIQGIDALTLGGLEALSTAFTDKPTDFSSPLGDFGRAIEDWGRSEMPIWFDKSAGFESLNYILGNLPNVASTVSMLIPQMGAARVIGGIGKALRSSQIANKLAQVGGGALVGRHIENTMEASRVFEESYKVAKEYGLSEEDARRNASEAAVTDYQMNYANLIFDVVQLGSILKPLKSSPKIGSAGERFNALNKVGYEAADKLAQSRGLKGILDGVNIYEKTALQGYRYFGAPLAQVTEGIEEFWNTTSQRESSRKAALDALEDSGMRDDNPEQYEAEKAKYEADTTFMERLSKYTGDKEFKDSFIWGWLGGTMYSALGKPVAKAMDVIKGNEPQLHGSIKAADFAGRNAFIGSHLKIQNDPKSDESTLIKSHNENIFKLAESALQAGNMDVLLEDLQDDAYVNFIATQNNIDVETAKKNVTELRSNLEQIAKDYNGFVGYNMDGYKGFQENVNLQPYGDVSTEFTNNVYDFGDRIEPTGEKYTTKDILGNMNVGEHVRLVLDVKDEDGNSVRNYAVARKRMDDKLTVDGQDITFTDNEIVEARRAEPVEDVESFNIKRKGLFGFVDPNVGIELTRLSYFSKMADTQAKKDSIKAIRMMNEKYGNANPMIIGYGDILMKKELTKNRAALIKRELANAKNSKVSKRAIADLEEDLKDALTREDALTQQLKAQTTLINDLMTDDVEVVNGLAFAGENVESFKKTINEIRTDTDLFELYRSGEDANIVKKQFARKRQRMIKDPVGYYKTLVEDNTKLKDYEATIKKDKEIYGIEPTDSEEIKTIKRQMVDLFKAEPKATDAGYNADLLSLYNKEKDKYAIQYSANPPLDATRKAKLEKELSDMRKKVATPEFDMLAYINLKAELDALNQLEAKAKAAAAPKIVVPQQEETEEDIAEMDKKFIGAANVFFDKTIEMSDLANLKSPDDFDTSEQVIATHIINPLIDMKRFYELVVMPTLNEADKIELSDLSKALNDEMYPFSLMKFVQQSPRAYMTVINRITGGYNSLAYSENLVVALQDSLIEAGKEFTAIGSYQVSDELIISIDEAIAKKMDLSKLKAIDAEWSVSRVSANKPVFDFIGFIEKGIPKAKAIFESKVIELQSIVKDTSIQEPAVITVVSPATKIEVEQGKASSQEPEPLGGIGAVEIVHNFNLGNGSRNIANPGITINNPTNDQYVDVMTGKSLSNSFNTVGAPLLNPEISVSSNFDFGLMNPDRAGSSALQAGDTVEITKQTNKEGIDYFTVSKVDKKGNLISIGTVSDSTKNNNIKSIAAEQKFADLFNNETKSIRFKLDSNSVGFGGLLQSEKISSDSKSLKKPLSLFDITNADGINNNDRTDSIQLGVFDGNVIGVRDGSFKAIVPTNGVIKGQALDSKYAGQVVALIPTNTVYSNEINPTDRGKQAYIRAVLNTNTLNSVSVDGLSMPSLILQKLADPQNNIDFIRQVAQMIGVSFNDRITPELIKQFYTEANMVKIFGHLMFLKGALKGEGASSKNYKYPIHVDTRIDKDKGVFSLQMSYLQEGAKKKTIELPIIIPNTESKVDPEALRLLAKSSIQTFDALYLKDKPFAVDSKRINDNTKSGAYVGFGIANNEVIVKTYPSYLHYLNENKIVTGTFGSVELPGQNRRTFFGKPRLVINFERAKLDSNNVMVGPRKDTDPKGATIIISKEAQQPIDQNIIADEAIKELEDTVLKTAILKEDETGYLVNGREYERVHTIMGSTIPESLILDKAKEFGTDIDLAVREFLNTGSIAFENYSSLAPFQQELETGLKRFKDHLDKNGERVINGETTIYGTLYNKEGNIRDIAGATDIVTIDKTNKIRIYDTKSLRGKVTTDTISKRQIAWTEQLNYYRQLFKSRGYEVDGLFVLPIGIGYGEFNDVLTDLDFSGQIISIPKDENLEYMADTNYNRVENPISTTLTEMAKTEADIEAELLTDFDADFGDPRNNVSGNQISSLMNLDGDKSMYDVLIDQSLDAMVRGNIMNVVSSTIMDVLFDQTVIKRQGDINVETSLKPKVKAALENQYKYFIKQAALASEANNQADVAKFKKFAKYRQEAINRFDAADYSTDYKNSLGEFAGYFKAAYIAVSSSKLVDNTIRSMEDDEGAEMAITVDKPEDAPNRFEDEFYTKINPKSTVVFQVKLFMSRIAIRDENGEISRDDAGTAKYYSLDEMMMKMFSYMDVLGPTVFSEGNTMLLELAESQNDLPMQDLLVDIAKLDNLFDKENTLIQWPFTKNQIMAKLASATIKHNRNTKIVSMNYDRFSETQMVGGMKSKIMDTNRQSLQSQIRGIWDTNFKDVLSDFYEIGQATVEEGQLPVTKITGLAKSKVNKYEKIVKAANTEIAELKVPSVIEGSRDASVDGMYNMYVQLWNLKFAAIDKPGTNFYLQFPEGDSFNINDENGKSVGAISREDFKTALTMVEFPENVFIPKELSENLKDTVIGNVAESVSRLLNMTDGEIYSDQVYFLLGEQLDRLGINLSQKEGGSGAILKTLQFPAGNRSVFQTLDPKAKKLRMFLRETLLDNLINKLGDSSEMEQVDIETPFNNLGMALNKLAKLSKVGYPTLINPNSTSIFGENEYTIVEHTYLSYKTKQFKNSNAIRAFYLNENPLTKDSLHIKELFGAADDSSEAAKNLDRKPFEAFDIHDIRGVNFNNNHKISNKTLNETQRAILDYNLFQNGESAKEKGRNIGYFTTTHGESTSIPAISMYKQNIDYNFVVDENETVSLLLNTNKSRTYDLLVSQFTGEVNAVVEAEKIFRTLERIEKELGIDKAITYAKQNYVAEKHYHIKDGKLLPGNRTKFYMFGSDMMNDTKGLIYDKSTGRLNSSFEPFLTDSDVGEIRTAMSKIVGNVFNNYINEFLNNLINIETEILSRTENEWFVESDVIIDKNDPSAINSNRVVGVKFPLFDNSYAYKMTRHLLFGGSDAADATKPMKIISKNEDPIVTSTDDFRQAFVLQNDVRIASPELSKQYKEGNEQKRLNNKLFGKLQKHYMIADMVINYLIFYNTYDSLYSDNVSFSKADNYFALMEEKNKRYKTLMGPGAISAGNMEFDVQNKDNTNLVYVHVIEDIKAKDLVSDMMVSNIESNMKYNDFVNWIKKLPNTKLSKNIKSAFDFTNAKVVSVPSNFDDISSFYIVNKNTMPDAELQDAVWTYLNQDMTDGGAVIDIREQIARFVRNGDLDINKAPALYAILNDKALTYEKFEQTMKDFKLNRNSFQISKFIYSGTTPGEYKHDMGTTRADEFNIIKNSEMVIIPAFAKGLVWEGALADAEKSLNQFLRSRGIDPNSPQAFMFGNIIAPKSNVKSASRIPVKSFDKNGNYISGSIGSATPMLLSREHFRKQGGKDIKDDMLTTASSQLQQMSLLGLDSLTDFSTNNSYGFKINQRIGGRQIANTRYELENQFTSRAMIKIFNRMGVEMIKNKPVIRDMALFIKSMTDQVVNQQGIGLHLEAFKVDKLGKLNAPLSYTPFNVMAQNVLLSQFDKAVKRKISGFSLIQASTFGMFAKENVQADSSLKGSRVEIIDSGRSFFTKSEVSSTYAVDDIYKIEAYNNAEGVQLYRVYLYKVLPSEIAIGWNLKDTDGSLLKYEDYVDPITMLPLPGKIDDDLLYNISYRVPNTPHNTTSYSKVVKFLPPMYKDVVLVSPQTMTAMSSDLDVDVLNVMFYKYNVVENGRLQKIQSIINENQENESSLLNSTANKEAVLERLRKEDYTYSTLKVSRDRKLSKFIRKQETMLGILNDERLTLETKITMLEDTGLDASELKSLLETYIELQQQDPNIQSNAIREMIDEDTLVENFPDEYFRILDENENITDNDALAELKIYANKLRRSYIKESKKFDRANIDLVLDKIKAEIQDLSKLVEEGSSLSLIELDSQLKQADARIKKNFQDRYTGMDMFDKQSGDQLNNALIDTFMLQYSSPTGYRLSSQPLGTNLLKEKVEGENIKWLDEAGDVQKISFDNAIVQKGFRALNSITTRRQAKAAAQDNGAMIGVFANSLRLLQYASAAGFYVNASDGMKKGISYAASKADEKGILKTAIENVNGQFIPKMKKEDDMEGSVISESGADSSIHSPGYLTYSWGNPAFKSGGRPDNNTRYRLDRTYHIDNSGNRSYSYKIMLQSLQSVLDGVKDPVATKMNLNMGNVNAYVAHIMLGHFDEIIPLFRQPSVIKYMKEVIENTVEKTYPSEDIKIAFINRYIKENDIKGLKVLPDGMVFKEAINYLETLLSEQSVIVSEATLKEDIITAYNLDGLNKQVTNEFKKRQLMSVLNYMKSDAIGTNLITVANALNTYAKGISGTILELDEKNEQYDNLLKFRYTIEGEALITSSAPLIGNLGNLSVSKFKRSRYDSNFKSAKVGVEHTMNNVVSPLISLVSDLTTANVFTELSSLNKLVYEAARKHLSTDDKLKIRQKASDKKDLAIAFESFMFSNPYLFKNFFEGNVEEYEIFNEFGIEALVLRNEKINPELTKRLAALEKRNVLIADESLADLVERIKNKKNAKGIANKRIYKLLDSLKELNNNNSQGNADLLIYMNIIDYKNGFSSENMLTISQMLKSTDNDIKALGKQLIMYAFMSGGISSPNSFIKFVAQTDIKSSLKTLNDLLQGLNEHAAKKSEKSFVKEEVQTFMVQYFQHNPSKAPVLRQDYRIGILREGKDGGTYHTERYYDEDLNKLVIPVRRQSGDIQHYNLRPVIKEVDENGNISLFMFQNLKGKGYAYVAIDNAGNSRYNFREYKYNADGKAINSVIVRNVKGGKRGMIIKRLEDEAETMVTQNRSSIIELLTEKAITASTYLSRISNKTSPTYSFVSERARRYANYVIKANLYPIEIKPESNMDSYQFGSYNQQLDIISLNSDYIIKHGEDNIERVIETINHELTHAAIDRSISGWLNPMFTVDDGNGDRVPFLDANQKMMLERPMRVLNAIISYTGETMNSKTGQYHKLLTNLSNRYKTAQKDGDIGAMKDLAFIPAVFQKIEEFRKIHGANVLADPKTMNQRQLELYTPIVKEFVSYFMTNEEFQQLLNQVSLEKAKKTIWQEIIDAFLEILDILTGAKAFRRLDAKEQAVLGDITENSLAHATAVASFDLIDVTGNTREDGQNQYKKVTSRLRELSANEFTDGDITNGLGEDGEELLFLAFGTADKTGAYDIQAKKHNNLFSFPLKKDSTNYFSKLDIPFIEEQFSKLIEKAKRFNITYILDEFQDSAIAEYKGIDKSVHVALLKGIQSVKDALDKKNTSSNRIDLLNDLLQFKFEKAEIDERAAYKKCTK